MFPHEAQELAAKILFFFFAISLLMLTRVQAQDLSQISPVVTSQKTILAK